MLAAERVDLVLLDIHMPVLDGIQTLKRIRSSSEPWRDVPVIALTADAMSGDRERYLAEGMDGYLSKPIDKLDLMIEIQKLLGSEQMCGAKISSAPSCKNAPPKSTNEPPQQPDQDLASLLAEMDAPSPRSVS
jgi:DNA-binding response OmpR family regulator